MEKIGINLIQSQMLRNFSLHEYNVNTALERLSGGLRIRQAKDDPSGMAMVGSLTTQIRGYTQIDNNLHAAISLGDTAHAGIQGIVANLQRMRELTLYGMNDTTTPADRSRIQAEFQKLVQDTDKLARETRFNSRVLLDGSIASTRHPQAASGVITENYTFSSSSGSRVQFLNPAVIVDPNIAQNDTFVFRQTLDPLTQRYGLEVRSARAGVVMTYADINNTPGTFQLQMPGPNGGALNVQISRADTGFERRSGPVTTDELNLPLSELVSRGRLGAVSYGSLAVNLGSQTFQVGVAANTTLQGVLNSLNALSSGGNVVNASYDSTTGRMHVTHTGQATVDRTTLTPYTTAQPLAAGGPYTSFVAMPGPAQGPAYREIFLPAVGFSVNAAPAGFPTLPSALDTRFDFSGSDASVLNFFGLANSGNQGTVTAYNSVFYGETVATANASEYVNRTRAVISSVTAEQTAQGTATGLSSADLNTPLTVLGTAKVTAPTLVAGNLTIDFGSNGIFSYAVDPGTTTIDHLVSAIEAFSPYVSASFDASTDQLTLRNDPPLLLLPKVTAVTLNLGLAQIDFGSNGILSFAFNPLVDTIQSVVGAINGFAGGRVTAAFDANTDRLTITNNGVLNNKIDFLNLTANQLATFFKLSDAASTGAGLQSITSSGDIDNSILSPALDISAANVTSSTFAQLTTPLILPQNNSITFAGANGAAVATFFKLGNVASTGSGAQVLTSSASISNRALDSSLDVTAADVLNTPMQVLRTPKVTSAVSGPLVVNGQTAIHISASTTLTHVLDALNNLAGTDQRTYSASWSGGALQIHLRDTETLAAAGSQPLASPGASPTVVANQISLDSSAYFATGAPVFEQPAFAATPLPAPYVTQPGSAPDNLSGISFGGTSNLASLLFLSSAASGSPTGVSDQYRGVATATGHNTYTLEGTQRRTFSASSAVSSTQQIGLDNTASGGVMPVDGVLARVSVSARVAPQHEDRALRFQITPNEGGTLALGIRGLTAERLYLADLFLYREGDSNIQARLRGDNALRVLDRALAESLDMLSQVGSVQYILEGRQGLNALQRDMALQARSRIQDTDVSTEISRYTQAQIRAQAGAFALSQAQLSRAGIVDILFASLSD